jgi:ribose 5-phosphate isomerase B
MRVAIAADHGGFALKAPLVQSLREDGHDVLDLGAFNTERTDYPDFAEAVGRALQNGRADRGFVICGSGVGACIAANKMRGIRASVCHDTYSAHQGVEHDDMNVLVLGARIVGEELAKDISRAFLSAHFNNGERYIARLKKVERLERDLCN